MRPYGIAIGILFVLSSIDFAPAAPVLGQEKREARADVVHLTKDVITVLEKRLEGELEKQGGKYLKTGAHPSRSIVPLEPGHGSTDAVQLPASNTANSDPLMESPCLSSASSMRSLSARGNWQSFVEFFDAEWPEWPSKKRPEPSDSSSDYEPPPSHSDSDSTSSSDFEYDREYWRPPTFLF